MIQAPARTLHDGKHRIVFRPKSHRYFVYDERNNRIPNVFNVSGVTHALHNEPLEKWKIGQAVGAAIELSKRGYGEKSIASLAASYPRRMADVSASIGTEHHNILSSQVVEMMKVAKIPVPFDPAFCENMTIFEAVEYRRGLRSTGEPLSAAVMELVEKYEAEDNSLVIPVGSEVVLFDKSTSTAGTSDLILLELFSGGGARFLVSDLKTGRRVHREHWVQIGQYRYAVSLEVFGSGYVPSRDDPITKMEPITIIHYPVASTKNAKVSIKRPSSFKSWDGIMDARKTFVAMLHCTRFLHGVRGDDLDGDDGGGEEGGGE